MKVNFEQCDHQEVADYIWFYNEKLQGTDFYCKITKEELTQSLNSAIKITHRALHHVSVEAGYNAIRMIQMLNAYKPETLEKEEQIAIVEEVTIVSLPVVEEKHVDPAKETPEIISSEPISEDKGSNVNDKTLSSSLTEDSDDDDCGTEEEEEDEEIIVDPFEKWHNDYIKYTNKNAVFDKAEAVSTVKEYLGKMEETMGRENKVVLVRELYTYMARTPSFHLFMWQHRRFLETLADKVKEFVSSDPDVFQLVDDDVKAFVSSLVNMEIK